MTLVLRQLGRIATTRKILPPPHPNPNASRSIRVGQVISNRIASPTQSPSLEEFSSRPRPPSTSLRSPPPAPGVEKAHPPDGGLLEMVGSSRSEAVLVWQRAGAVRQRLLTSGKLAPFAAFVAEQPLAEATKTTVERDFAFELATALAIPLTDGALEPLIRLIMDQTREPAAQAVNGAFTLPLLYAAGRAYGLSQNSLWHPVIRWPICWLVARCTTDAPSRCSTNRQRRPCTACCSS